MKWLTINEYYNIVNGDQITEKEYKTKFYTVKKTKNTKIHEYKSGTTKRVGHVKYFHECRLRPTQRRLF